MFPRLWIDDKSKINSIGIDTDISVDLLNNGRDVGGTQALDVQIGGGSAVHWLEVCCIQLTNGAETLGEDCQLSQVDCQLDVVQQQEEVELDC